MSPPCARLGLHLQLKALPSEYFMGSHGPGSRCCPEPSRGFTGKNNRRGSCWPGAGSQLWWARCPPSPGQENGHGARRAAGMGARLQLLEGLMGLGVGSTPGALPWDVPAGLGALTAPQRGPCPQLGHGEGAWSRVLVLGVPLGCAGWAVRCALESLGALCALPSSSRGSLLGSLVSLGAG